MVSNPTKEANHYYVETWVCDGSNFRDYKNQWDTWKKPRDLVGAIIGDGDPAQVKGLCHWKRCGALYPSIQTVYIRCVAHLINLALLMVNTCKALVMILKNTY